MNKQLDSSADKIFAFSLSFLVLLGAPLALYIQYLFRSIGRRVVVDGYSGQEVILHSKGSVNVYSLANLEKIVKVCSGPVAKGRTKWLPTDTFFYYKLIFKGGQEVIITSLMADNDFSISGYRMEKDKRFIAVIN